jgi:uncharacterized protein YggE
MTTLRNFSKASTSAIALGLLAVSSANIPAMAQIEVEATAANPVVELTVTEQVQSAPDMATFGTGVTTKAPTAQAALRDNSQKMAQLIQRIQALGVERKHIQTSGLSLNAEYDYRNNESPVFKGYQVTNQLQVTIMELDRLGMILDAVVAAGANNLNGPSFSIDDDLPIKQQARERAMERAKAQAMDYARRAGFGNVQLLSVSEGYSAQGPMPMAKMQNFDMAESSVPIEGGQVGTAVTVSVRYQMVR